MKHEGTGTVIDPRGYDPQTLLVSNLEKYKPGLVDDMRRMYDGGCDPQLILGAMQKLGAQPHSQHYQQVRFLLNRWEQERTKEGKK